MNSFKIKRIYDKTDKSDGLRVLVDRIWPRGITKEKAQLTVWMKEIAPSTELRKWFQHVPENFESFKQQYLIELAGETAKPYLEQLRSWIKDNTVTLLYAAKDEHYNQAVILKEYLDRRH